MRILALQLKRIGDLVLTTPALRALHAAWPEAHLALGVMDGTSGLLPAIPWVHSAIVFGKGRGWAPWQQVLTGGWDLCLDFTGNDRSALATALSRASTRRTFTSVQRKWLRARAYNAWCPSKVRDVHTAQHYLHLVTETVPKPATTDDLQPQLTLPPDAPTESGIVGDYALLHPGTARPEKYWLPERWGEVANHLRETHGLKTVFSCGPDPFERAHVRSIPGAELPGKSEIRQPRDLLALTALAARARLVVSCDTAIVHLAAAFRVPQVALYGPINPFHWRPLHDRAVVLSAAHPNAPLTDFEPRMKEAPMDQLPTALVIRATDTLLARVTN
ncbi:MAG TPA: glycosyltransferase family 9 protein [Chthoniobacter sp.]|jgi:ADP-heptose:LPS heptosyltransferase